MNNTVVFVTGINGFIGRNLRPYLSEDFELRSISIKRRAGGITYDNFFQENIQFETIIHLAGKAHDLRKTLDDEVYYDVNFDLTRCLFDKFLQSDAKTFIFMSSVKSTAETVEGVLTENVLPNPVTVYGKSKLMAEDYIMANLPVDKKVYILRPCMIHGPGNKGNLNLLYSFVSKGLPWPLGSFQNSRSYLSIQNLCFIIKELIERKDIPFGIYNLADDDPLSTNDVINLIAESMGKKVNILNLNTYLINVLARVGDFFNIPFNSARLQKLTESYVVSNAKIKQVLGKQLPVSTKEGLIRTFQSFAANP